ncbi:ABC transporter [Mesotoga sp. Brook.08.YT.4.2.5.1]|uniref:ABC transporter permease n=1 Tax=unclassified Mesotoga TaxID=1184398 RepID=UPI000C9AEEF2|nr:MULTISPECIES: ABC transporter permease [unclassified Mesotoga]PNE22295.1 ABC transporter [Mesotoga sp. Brook.08.YT.4.2.5.1]PXF33719.1 ABC transporter [Mesotoga sp. SC_NapDC]RAO96281.1 ABC transporter [Mesotoga sp. Brook.08.YT.4.2.5.4.]RDI90961.1 ABC transporter [Mesotoga sp. Brook.08.YT.4.2.5.2.]
MSSALAYWTILMKDMKNYYLKPPNISWGIIFPISWTLMFFVRSEGPVDIRGILPGVMSLSVLFGTTSMLAVTITFERKSRSFERLLLAPISLKLLMLAKTTGAIFFGIINAFIPVLLALMITDLTGINWFLVATSVVLIAVTSTFLGLFIAVSVSEVFEAQTFSNFFRFPMMFLCGLFIPIENLPVFLRPLSFIFPLTYGADSLKHAIDGNGIISPLLSFFVQLGFSAFLFFVSTRNIEKRWIY